MTKTLVLLACLAVSAVFADQVEMQNGDHYSGHVLSLTADAVVLQNDNIGRITLPRAKIAYLGVGASNALPALPATNHVKSMAATNVATSSDIAGALRHLGANTNFIEQIRGQFLADAGPQANQMFTDTLGGLASGKIDLASLRAQAKSTADQLRAYERELGPEAGETFSSYLSILDNFLAQTSDGAALSTNRSPTATLRGFGGN
ncbi:MAG TPA: hypothetical protein VHB20_18705 [Verrucomicrobiae bacterium]|jgi:hypothetical protein|nr:hypothetical protein [Verrucomicrobiae bacterium]